MAEGVNEKKRLRGAGFTEQDISNWEAATRKDLSDAGFSGKEVDEYFGVVQPNLGPLRSSIEENLKPKPAPAEGEAAPAPAPQVKTHPSMFSYPAAIPVTPMPTFKPKAATDFSGQREPMSFLESFESGFNLSVTGLLISGKNPEAVLPENAAMYERIAYQLGLISGDIPPMIVGAVGGGMTGGAIGTSVPVVGTATGTLLGAGAGAFALPEAMRQSLMDSYEKGAVQGWEDYWERTAAMFIRAFKGGVTGIETVGAGAVVKQLGGKTAAQLAAEIGTMVTVGSALEGHVPRAQDFMDAAILLFGLKGSVAGAAKLRNIYAKTGLRPEHIAEHAQREPTVKQDLLSNRDIPQAYEGLQSGPTKSRTIEIIGAGKEPKLPKEMVDRSKVTSEEFSPGEPTVRIVRPLERTQEPTMKPPRTPEEQAVLDRIAREPDRPGGTSWGELYTNIKDDLHPIKVIEKLLAGKKIAESGESPYDLARLTRGTFGKGDHFLEWGTFSYKDLANNGKGLKQVLEPILQDIEGFSAYAVAARSLELAKRDIDTGVPVADARAVVRAGNAKYKQVFGELQGYQNRLLGYLRDSGILSKEQFDLALEANKNYIPFYRLFEEGGGGRGAGRGLRVRNPVKEIKGSERKIIDPIESIIKNTYLYLTLAERNRAGQALLELSQGTPYGKELVKKVPTPTRPLEIKEAEVAKFLEEHGLSAAEAEAFVVFRPQILRPTENQIVVFREGKREVYEVAPEVARAFGAMDRQSVGLFTRLLSIPAKTLRAGSVLSPEFMSRNVIRDQSSAFILSKNGFIPVFDMLRGMGSLIKKDAHYQEWIKSGGPNSTLVSMDRDYIQSHVFKLSKQTGLIDKAWNVTKSPLEILRAGSELLENATRVGEFKRARAQGRSLFEAGMASREVTLDFARIGAKTRAMNMLTAFWNAHVEGLDRTVRAFAERPGATLTKTAASITLPSILLWWANKDDPRWNEIPRWQKDLFWIVLTDDNIIRIPKPFELGILFGSVPERVLEAYFTENPKALKDFEDTILGSLAPEMIWTVMTPAIEQFANRSTFTGSPLVSAANERLLPEYQYNDHTTETAKALGRVLSKIPGVRERATDPKSFLLGGISRAVTSPAIFENYVRAWSGGLGMYAVQLMDKSLQAAGVLPQPIKPTATPADIPVVKAFVVRHPSGSAQSIQDFYDTYYTKKRIYDTIRSKAKEGDVESVERELALQSNQSALIQLDETRQALTNMNKVIHMINRDTSMTPDEKRQTIDDIYYMMIEVANGGNFMLNEIDKALNQKD